MQVLQTPKSREGENKNKTKYVREVSKESGQKEPQATDQTLKPQNNKNFRERGGKRLGGPEGPSGVRSKGEQFEKGGTDSPCKMGANAERVNNSKGTGGGGQKTTVAQRKVCRKGKASRRGLKIPTNEKREQVAMGTS